MWRRLTDWCVPAGAVFPRHLTRGDPPPYLAVKGRWIGSAEFEELRARFREAHGWHGSPLILPTEIERVWK